VSANTLLVQAERRNGATAVSRLLADGLWRTSRSFHEGSATRIVLAQLGPGMIRGDRFASRGTVGPGAHLIVAGQMATRILPGREPVTTSASWSVEAGGRLELLAEPTMICEGAAYETRLTLALAADAIAVVCEIIVCAESATARIATTVTRDGHTVVVDVLELADDARDKAANVVGTLIVLGPADLAALDRAADECPNARIGIGTFQAGDTLVRIAGTHVQPVREALARLHDAITSP
jgi:urease accessory protein UreH